MKKDYLKVLNYNDIYSHYNARVVISSTLQDLLRSGDKAKYSELALGISDPYGNYSASQHGLGEKILSVTSENKIFELDFVISHKASEYSIHISRVFNFASSCNGLTLFLFFIKILLMANL